MRLYFVMQSSASFQAHLPVTKLIVKQVITTFLIKQPSCGIKHSLFLVYKCEGCGPKTSWREIINTILTCLLLYSAYAKISSINMLNIKYSNNHISDYKSVLKKNTNICHVRVHESKYT